MTPDVGMLLDDSYVLECTIGASDWSAARASSAWGRLGWNLAVAGWAAAIREIGYDEGYPEGFSAASDPAVRP